MTGVLFGVGLIALQRGDSSLLFVSLFFMAIAQGIYLLISLEE